MLLETTRSLKGSVHYAILYPGTSTKLTNFRSELPVLYGSEYWTCTAGITDLTPSRRDKRGQGRDKEFELEECRKPHSERNAGAKEQLEFQIKAVCITQTFTRREGGLLGI